MISQSVTVGPDFFFPFPLFERRIEELITVSNSGTLLNGWSRGDEAGSKEHNGSLGEEHGGKLNNIRPTGLSVDMRSWV